MLTASFAAEPYEVGPFEAVAFDGDVFDGTLCEGEPIGCARWPFASATGAAFSATGAGGGALLLDPLRLLFDVVLPLDGAAKFEPPPFDAIAPSADFEEDDCDKGNTPSYRCTATTPP